MDSDKVTDMARELGHFLEPIENPKWGACRCCKKSVAGSPAYGCSRCEFFVHKSCPEVTEKTKMEFKHESIERHHFFKTEITADMNKAVCSMCKEIEAPLPGENAPIIFKCFIPNCTYFIHKSCAEAHTSMLGFHLHDPNHPLNLKPPMEIQHCCYACGKRFSGSFFYECDRCEYEIHFKCIFNWRVSPNECNPHAFIPIGIQIEFTCQVCGKKRSDVGSVCSNCRFLIHTNCVRYPRIIKVRGRDHPLTITQPLSQRRCQGPLMCRICKKNMNKDYGGYCCEQACGFIAHLSCAYFEEDRSGTSGYASHGSILVEEDNEEHIPKQTLDSSLHQDELILMKQQPEGKSCAGCTQPIFLPPFYGCEKCKFFVHIKCAQVPREIDRPVIHEHRLRLSTTPSFFWCLECDCTYDGLFYACDECGWFLFDFQCALIPEAFNHKLHKHRLFRGSLAEPKCSACDKNPLSTRRLKCKTCDFWLCIRCATLPLVATHKYDKHRLRLANRLEENPDEFYCQICEEALSRNHWFYYCQDCDFIGHPNCVLKESKATKWHINVFG